MAVFEQSGELHEVGAGVGLQLGAVKALKRIGMLEAIMAVASEPQLQALELRNYRTGKLLAKLPQGEVAGDVGLFGLNIHRADLLSTLAEGAGSDVITLDSECVGFDQDADGVTARFADGREERGGLLVGADGLHSTIRRQIHGDTPLRYSGYTVWRSMPPFPDSGSATAIRSRLSAPAGVRDPPARGARVLVRLDGQGRRRARRPGGKKRELLELYRDWYSPIPALIEATPEEAIFKGDIYDRKPLERWGQGRVTLLRRRRPPDHARARTGRRHVDRGRRSAGRGACAGPPARAPRPGRSRPARLRGTPPAADQGDRRPVLQALEDLQLEEPAGLRGTGAVHAAKARQQLAKAFRAEADQDL